MSNAIKTCTWFTFGFLSHHASNGVFWKTSLIKTYSKCSTLRQQLQPTNDWINNFALTYFKHFPQVLIFTIRHSILFQSVWNCDLSNNAMGFIETSNACKINVSLHYHFFKHLILKLVSFSIMAMKTWNLSRTSNIVLRKLLCILTNHQWIKQNILHHLWTRFALVHKCQNAQDLEVCVFHSWLEINVFIVFLLDNFDIKGISMIRLVKLVIAFCCSIFCIVLISKCPVLWCIELWIMKNLEL